MKNALLVALLSALFLFMVVGCIGCSAEKKIQKAKHLLEDSGRLPGICADEFPVRDSVVYKDSIHFDTLLTGDVIIDTVVKNNIVYITKEVPKVITKTVTQLKEIFRENTARVSAQAQIIDKQNKAIQNLLGEVDRLSSQKENLKKDRNKWRLWCLLTWAACVGYLFRKPIFKLIS